MTEDSFTQFKGFVLTLFGSEGFIALLNKNDRYSIMKYIVDYDLYDKAKTVELLQMYNATKYSGMLAMLAKGEIIKAIVAKKDEVLASLANSTNKEELAFNKMLYNLEFFNDKRLADIKEMVNNLGK